MESLSAKTSNIEICVLGMCYRTPSNPLVVPKSQYKNDLVSLCSKLPIGGICLGRYMTHQCNVSMYEFCEYPETSTLIRKCAGMMLQIKYLRTVSSNLGLIHIRESGTTKLLLSCNQVS